MSKTFEYSDAAKRFRKGDYIGALTVLNQLIDSKKDARNYALMARTFVRLNMKSDAAELFDLAAAAGGPDKNEHRREAMILHHECGNDDAALLAAKSFMAKVRTDADVAYVLASIFLKRGEKDSLSALRQPLLESKNPRHLALALRLLSENLADEENFKTIKNILSRQPHDQALRFLHLAQSREFCDFNEIRKHQSIIIERMNAGNGDLISLDNPFHNLTWCEDERLNQRPVFEKVDIAALRQARRSLPHDWTGQKIRVGYLSSDFWKDHATMKLLGDVLEKHDREKFEIVLFCHTPAKFLSDHSYDRGKWGRAVSILGKPDAEAARIIRDEKIDILVDLKGHTGDNRVSILNLGTAPIQVSWLGFPGTTTGVDTDYVIGDPIVLPDTSRPFYHEKFVRLPETYQPNDPISRPRISPLTRDEVGLPSDKFIFASFNASRKISLDVIAAWGRILTSAKQSVIWLFCESPTTQGNLIKEFERLGVSKDRVFFAKRLPADQHINRIQLADVGLDTWPYNGHTTTSEQLWVGLPVLAKKGTHFASRVTESLLNAIGIPELVTSDVESYIETAISLANDPMEVQKFRSRLAANRFRLPLFDSERFCRHIEKSYEMMFARGKNGLDPDHFDVAALPTRETAFTN